MKTLVLSMISIAAILATMTACTSESDPVDEVKNNTEIKTTAGIGIVTTKAPINQSFSSDLDVLFFKPIDAATTDWADGEQVYARVAAASGHAITFHETKGGTEKKLYYNADVTKLSHLAGCYIDNATTTDDLTDGTITFSITGSQDIMATSGQSGSSASAFSAFTFNHLLAQLEFVIQPKEGADATAIQTIFGKVTKIELLEQDSNFDLTLGAIPSLVANEAPANKSFELIDTKAIATGTSFGQLMIYPTTTLGQTSTPIKLKVYTEKGVTAGYPVQATIGDGTIVMDKSKKYTITINFTTKDINASGAVGEWTSGGNGSTEI